MWKLIITYDDNSKLIITGKHKDIPLRLAQKYHNEYVSGNRCKAVYQRYPKKKYEAINLMDKMEELIMSEDITFCTNGNCKMTRCFRNKKNIKRFDIPHSFAELEGTEQCPSFKNKWREE